MFPFLQIRSFKKLKNVTLKIAENKKYLEHYVLDKNSINDRGFYFVFKNIKSKKHLSLVKH